MNPLSASAEDAPDSNPDALLVKAKANPFLFLPQEKIAVMFGLGHETVTALVRNGAPTLARKINPHLLFKWIEENRHLLQELGKVREAAKAENETCQINRIEPNRAETGPDRAESSQTQGAERGLKKSV